MRGLLILFLLSILFAAPRGAAAQTLSDETILRDFDIIAFRNEMRKLTNPRVIKWVRPLKIFLQMDIEIEPQVRDYLVHHMRRLASITRLAMHYQRRKEDANFLIIFTRRDDYNRTIDQNAGRVGAGHGTAIMRELYRSNCVTIYSTNQKSGEIVRAVVVIPVDSARQRGLLGRCIVEETTQSMGLPNDSDDVTPSIFNDRSRINDLTSHDILLLRLLYHPRMKVGLARARALEVARQILPEIRAQQSQARGRR